MTDNESNTKPLGFENNPSPKVADTPIGDFYLFAVGIDQYDQSKIPEGRPLKNCVRDVAAIVDCLVTNYQFATPDPSKGRDLKKLDSASFNQDTFPVVEYQDDKVFCLYNENAKAENFTNHLVRLIGKNNPLVKENDCLVLLFSGHGYVDPNFGTFYLVLHDQKFDATQLFRLLDDYTTRKCCRHFLLILDSCYSGEILFNNQGIRRDQDFSRNILASAQADQKAYDGLGGSRHSPFAECVLSSLETYKNMDSQMLDVEVGKKILPKTNKTQNRIYMAMPVNEMGKGHFPFQLKYQRPQPKKVREKLYDLNFNPQKQAIKFTPSIIGNRFNIITLKGETSDTQAFVAKVLFKKFLTAFQKNQKPESHFQKYPFEMGATTPSVLDFWSALNKGLGFESPVDTIHFILGQLLEKNLVLMCQLAPFEAQAFEALQLQLKSFLAELKDAIEAHELYQGKSEELKYLFFFFKDMQNNDKEFQLANFDPIDDTFNLFFTKKIDGIQAQDFNEWWDDCSSYLIETLEMPEIDTTVFQQNMPFENFILELTKHFGYSDTDRSELNKLLFDSDNSGTYVQI